ncbi:ribulose-phosphate 3-epimerase [Salmonella phage SSBI34]|nr:ribulose-phosphate 3-epimerase [Salmonella phage SSBI34]
MIIVNLNAPPKAGKDTICREIEKLLDPNEYHVVHMEFKELLFEAAVRISGITRKLWDALYEREYKETPVPFLQINGKNVSPRQWMIHCSENVMKPMFGNDVFGKAFAKKLENLAKELYGETRKIVVVVSDGGFVEESVPVVNQVGADNYLLVRIHRFKEDGTEYDFSGDSRRYIYSSEFPRKSQPYETDITNCEGQVSETAQEIINFMEDTLNAK